MKIPSWFQGGIIEHNIFFDPANIPEGGKRHKYTKE